MLSHIQQFQCTRLNTRICTNSQLIIFPDDEQSGGATLSTVPWPTMGSVDWGKAQKESEPSPDRRWRWIRGQNHGGVTLCKLFNTPIKVKYELSGNDFTYNTNIEICAEKKPLVAIAGLTVIWPWPSWIRGYTLEAAPGRELIILRSKTLSRKLDV